MEAHLVRLGDTVELLLSGKKETPPSPPPLDGHKDGRPAWLVPVLLSATAIVVGVFVWAVVLRLGSAPNGAAKPIVPPPASTLAAQSTAMPIVTRPEVAEATVAPPTPWTPTSTLRSTPANTVPALGIGSKMVSEQDGMTLVYVPAGEFLMGSADSDSDAR